MANHERNAATILDIMVTISTIATADGDVAGAWVICGGLIGHTDIYTGKQLLILNGPDKGDLTDITAFNTLTGRLDVSPSLQAQSITGDTIVVLSRDAAASVNALLLAIKAKTDNLPINPAAQTLLDVAVSTRAIPGDQMALTAATLLAIQALLLSDATPFPGADIPLIKTQTDKVWTIHDETAINTTAVNGSETNVVNLSTASTHYSLDSMYLKFADPGANTIDVRLYRLINGVETLVENERVTTEDYTTYYKLMDLFGVPSMQGDSIRIAVQASAGGPYAVTGSYVYRSNP